MRRSKTEIVNHAERDFSGFAESLKKIAAAGGMEGI